jgi:hypothetical protein
MQPDLLRKLLPIFGIISRLSPRNGFHNSPETRINRTERRLIIAADGIHQVLVAWKHGVGCGS